MPEGFGNLLQEADTVMQQTIPELGYLEQVYAFVRMYRIETTLTGLVVLNPIFTFFAVQAAKRRIPSVINRRMRDGEVWLLTYAVSFFLTALTWYAFIPDLPTTIMFFFMVLIALVLDRNVAWVMRWSKQHKPALYEWLKNDRRSKDRLDDSDEHQIGESA